MKIGIVTTWFERGAAYVSLQYAHQLQNSQAEILIYARGGYDEGFHPEFNIEVDNESDIIGRGGLHLNKFKKWITKNNLTHILFNEQSWWEPVLEAKRMGVVCCAYVDYYTHETVKLFDLYDLILCNTKRHFSVFKDFGKKVSYIPWGTETDLFKPKNKDDNTDKVIFFHSMGWSSYRKGTDLLIQAASKIKDRNRFKLIIHGQKDLYQLMPDKKDLIKELEKDNVLEVINKTVEAPGLYHLGDVYVYPTRLEGIGLSIAEALSCGLPTIVPDNGPMNEFITEKTCKKVEIERFFEREDGYYWPMCEVKIDALAKSMNYYINHKNILPELKRETREFALENLDWNKNSKSLFEIILNTRREKADDHLIKTAKQLDIKNIKAGWLYKLSPSIYKTTAKIYKSFK